MDSKLGRRHEILGILCCAVALLSGLSLYTYDARGGENLVGPLGESLGRALANGFGWAAGLFPVGLLMLTLSTWRPQTLLSLAARGAAIVVFLLLGCVLLHLFWQVPAFGGHLAGGTMGEYFGEFLRSLLGSAGAGVVCVATLAIMVVLNSTVSFMTALRAAAKFFVENTGGLGRLITEYTNELVEAWRTAQRLERQKQRGKARASRATRKPAKAATKTAKAKRPAVATQEIEALDEDEIEESDDESEGDEHSAILVDDGAEAEDEEYEDEEYEDEEEEEELEEEEPAPPPPSRSTGTGARDKRKPVIVAPVLDTQRLAALSLEAAPKTPRVPGQFVLPPTTLLTPTPERTVEIEKAALLENADRLVEKLAAYGVKGRVDEIAPGPVVTMYEFEPQSGTKISKIAGLSDDLAMALAAQKVRIVAPIPGKARVGFELPNDIRQTVYLRELLEHERWQNNQDSLPLAFGQDITGKPVYGDLSKMPHLLVAGATGSGKSVGLNVMLVSLLMKKTPEEVRLLMIDPKVVELAVFDGIPHMLLPVVTDMKKASLALRWAVDEMERRYQLFADAGARNLFTYNARVDRVALGELSVAAFAPRRAGKVRAQGPNGEELLLSPTDGDDVPDAESWQPERLPSIVLVVDEFADLMMVASKDVESAIARLAQKARAAGIHVILATQRPSVDVITGMIKANFPSRIGYKVSQREDSKTILGRTGAEHLLGLGDMLCLMPGSNDLKRVHSAYISEEEVKELCDYLRAQGTPVYDDNILRPRDDEDDGDMSGPMVSDDPLYDRAVAIVAQAGYCSISHIQRNLSVGYNKAAKLVERMEKEGVVGPASGKAGGRREVFIEAR
ncbi:MAG: hypothetical protein RL701_552 [Pseudomonadota bacterium]